VEAPRTEPVIVAASTDKPIKPFIVVVHIFVFDIALVLLVCFFYFAPVVLITTTIVS
jgi:hypothetical protein